MGRSDDGKRNILLGWPKKINIKARNSFITLTGVHKMELGYKSLSQQKRVSDIHCPKSG